MTDPATYAQLLASGHLLRRKVMEELVALLALAPGARVLDAGCGTGLVAAMLGRVVGQGGLVAGLDLDPDLVRLGPGHAALAGVGERAAFVSGEAGSLPFAAESFDCVLSVDCVGYPAQGGAAAMARLLGEFGRVLRPGGQVVLAAWTGQQLLPGHPELEAQLGATLRGLAPFSRSMAPEAHFLRGLSWFRAAGYGDLGFKVLAGSVQGPLGRQECMALGDLFAMRWGGGEDLAPALREAYRRLTRLDSPDCLLHLPDYAALFYYAVLTGRKPCE